MKMNLRFILTTLIVLLICGAPLVASAQLFDGEREGLLLGVGVGFTAVGSTWAVKTPGYSASGSHTSGPGFLASGKIGYGLSDQFSLFLSSTVRDFSPHLGFLYFTDSAVYLQGLIGFVNSENKHFADHLESSGKDRHLLISGGVGYELRDQISLEFMLGYTRYTAFSGYGAKDILTIAATFNVHFY